MAKPSETPSSSSQRINKFLARCGLGSRRACEELVRQNRVQINGELISSLSTHVTPEDEIRVDGKLVKAAESFTIAYHKPAGLLCTQDDPQGRQTIYDALPARLQQLQYAGRLDRESEGLLILTNDGKLASQLTHPRHEIEKEYLVTLHSAFDPRQLGALLEGIRIEEENGRFQLARAHAAELISPRRLRLVLKQGIKRQIRAMMAALGYRVKRLLRIRIGKLTLNQLPAGRWRSLNPQDLIELKSTDSTNPQKSANPDKHSSQKFRSRKFKEGKGDKQAEKTAEDQGANKSPNKNRDRRHPSARPTRNSFVKNRKAGAKRWKRH